MFAVKTLRSSLLILILTPAFAFGANIDEIAYLSNKSLKELSSRAMSLISTSSLGLCGRRRELKITGRGASENWREIIQSALKRDQPGKKSVRINPVGKSASSVDSAVNRMLVSSGYQMEIPSEIDETVKLFKAGVKAHYLVFSVFSGQVRAVDSGHAIAFLALADDINNELLILSLGEELCR